MEGPNENLPRIIVLFNFAPTFFRRPDLHQRQRLYRPLLWVRRYVRGPVKIYAQNCLQVPAELLSGNVPTTRVRRWRSRSSSFRMGPMLSIFSSFSSSWSSFSAYCAAFSRAISTCCVVSGCAPDSWSASFCRW